MSERTLRIRTQRLCKNFTRRYGRGSAVNWFRRLVGSGDGASQLRALEDISFEAHAGEIVGLVGNNGAGKTTLLKVIAGILRESSGEVERRGRLALLSGLGVGMVPDLTVRENTYLYGAICGLHRTRITERFDEIIDWAELSEFVAAPLRNLSTGMSSRLAFSIARHIDTPIILMDEAMSAGDERFRKRCEAHFESRLHGDTAMVMASHSLELVEKFCDRTLWLRYGKQVDFGATADVLREYRAWVS